MQQANDANLQGGTLIEKKELGPANNNYEGILVSREEFNEEDKTHYQGQMKKCIRPDKEVVWIKHGKGKQTWDTNAQYDGDWHEGKMQGRGKFIHSNGEIYDGEFVADKANGYG